MLEAIRGARRSITIEAYIYWRGEIGLEFAQAIAERAKAGVPVKLLLDAVGSATIGDEILKVLEDGGCQLAWFNPIGWYTLDRFNYRTHRKSLIIDGCLAFTGGAGIADHWRGCAQDPEHWRDMQIRIEGPGAIPLQTGFAQNWLRTTGELVSGPEFFHLPEPAGDAAVMTVLSSPSAGASPVRTLYYLAIASARRSILIANPYFVPDQVAVDALRAALRPRRRRAGASCRASATTTGWPATTACACSGRCSRPGSRSTNTTARCCTRRRWSSTTRGRRSAPPTSTTARSPSTKRATSRSTTTRCIAAAGADLRRRPGGRASASPSTPGSGAALVTRAQELVAALFEDQV